MFSYMPRIHSGCEKERQDGLERFTKAAPYQNVKNLKSIFFFRLLVAAYTLLDGEVIKRLLRGYVDIK